MQMKGFIIFPPQYSLIHSSIACFSNKLNPEAQVKARFDLFLILIS